ncbi:MAG: hypothetical protein DRJ42_10150, partial [Deltaproteobacteria bacterium]
MRGDPIVAGSLIAGRYRVEKKLGAGGMGAVYLATRIEDGARVVIKTMLASWAKNPVAKKRFAREAEAASLLVHPGLVRILEFDADAETPILVMEHLDGRTLTEVIREPPMMDLGRAVELLRQLLEALGAAHGRGVTHRDLKPANIMVIQGPDGAEQIKVLDFGLAHILDEERRTRLTKTGQILGTPGYLAPEQAKGDPVDARTDLFAVGVIFYVMLAEKLPFPGKDTATRLIAMLTEEPAPLSHHRPDVPDSMVVLIQRCLEKEPGNRYASAAMVARALADATRADATLSMGARGVPTLPTRRLRTGPVDAPVTTRDPTHVAAPVATRAATAAQSAMAGAATPPTAAARRANTAAGSAPRRTERRRRGGALWIVAGLVAVFGMGAAAVGAALTIGTAPPLEWLPSPSPVVPVGFPASQAMQPSLPDAVAEGAPMVPAGAHAVPAEPALTAAAQTFPPRTPGTAPAEPSTPVAALAAGSAAAAAPAEPGPPAPPSPTGPAPTESPIETP